MEVGEGQYLSNERSSLDSANGAEKVIPESFVNLPPFDAGTYRSLLSLSCVSASAKIYLVSMDGGFAPESVSLQTSSRLETQLVVGTELDMT